MQNQGVWATLGLFGRRFQRGQADTLESIIWCTKEGKPARKAQQSRVHCRGNQGTDLKNNKRNYAKKTKIFV